MRYPKSNANFYPRNMHSRNINKVAAVATLFYSDDMSIGVVYDPADELLAGKWPHFYRPSPMTHVPCRVAGR